MPLKKIDFHNGCPYQTDEGLYYYAADVEPILNSLQQLKAEIAAIVAEFDSGHYVLTGTVDKFINKLRQLSAV